VHRSGPTFAHLFGRRAGSVPGYPYSAPLRDATFVWNEQTLAELFEKGPAAFLPGTKMPLQRIPDREALKALIDYLKILTNPEQSAQTPPD
jgi:cytochrome c